MSYLYVNQSDNSVWHINTLRSLHRNVSIPEGGDLTSHGYALLQLVQRPSPLDGHNVVELPPVNNVQTWAQVPFTEAEIVAALHAKREAMIVTPRQIRQALTIAGLRTSIEAAIDAADQSTKDWYEFATAFERLHPAVVSLAVALGVSDTQLDDLFTLAGSL